MSLIKKRIHRKVSSQNRHMLNIKSVHLVHRIIHIVELIRSGFEEQIFIDNILLKQIVRQRRISSGRLKFLIRAGQIVRLILRETLMRQVLSLVLGTGTNLVHKF